MRVLPVYFSFRSIAIPASSPPHLLFPGNARGKVAMTMSHSWNAFRPISLNTCRFMADGETATRRSMLGKPSARATTLHAFKLDAESCCEPSSPTFPSSSRSHQIPPSNFGPRCARWEFKPRQKRRKKKKLEPVRPRMWIISLNNKVGFVPCVRKRERSNGESEIQIQSALE